MKTTIYFVRHGQSKANLLKRVAGVFDLGLTKTGRKQGEAVAKYFKHKQIDAVYSSHLPRAETTAFYTAKQKRLALNIEKDLMEFNFGSFYEGMKDMDAFRHDPELFRKFLSKDKFMECSFQQDGETILACCERMHNALKKIGEKHSGQTVVVAGHSCALRFFLAYLENGCSLVGAVAKKPAPNASITTFEVEDGEIRVVEEGYTAHLKAVTV
jgi:probable phosphoglycerate mutase